MALFLTKTRSNSKVILQETRTGKKRIGTDNNERKREGEGKKMTKLEKINKMPRGSKTITEKENILEESDDELTIDKELNENDLSVDDYVIEIF